MGAKFECNMAKSEARCLPKELQCRARAAPKDPQFKGAGFEAVLLLAAAKTINQKGAAWAPK